MGVAFCEPVSADVPAEFVTLVRTPYALPLVKPLITNGFAIVPASIQEPELSEYSTLFIGPLFMLALHPT